MADCKNRIFPPMLPYDYERKEQIAEDRSKQKLFFVDGVAVYGLVERRIGNVSFSLLIQLPDITREAAQNACKVANAEGIARSNWCATDCSRSCEEAFL